MQIRANVLIYSLTALADINGLLLSQRTLLMYDIAKENYIPFWKMAYIHILVMG